MKFKLIILFAFMSIATATQLVAYQTGTVSFPGCNCRGDNDPNPVEFSISVMNPSPFPLTLSYEWYDPSVDFYRQGTLIKCYGSANPLPPNSVDSCTLRAYTMMGGLNGTSDINVILIGAARGENYTTAFDVPVSYHASPFEANLLSRMQGVEYNFDQLTNALGNACNGSSCCGMLSVNGNLSLASGNLSSAKTNLRECQLSSSWNYIMDASNSVRAANESFVRLKDNCSSAAYLINDTDLRVASVAKVVSEGKKCGSNVTLSELQLSDANSSLKEATQALASDDYKLAFSRLRDANSSLYSAVSSIGKCPSSTPKNPIVAPAKSNSTNSSPNQTSSGDNTLLILGGAFAGLLILAAAAFAVLSITRNRPRKKEAPKSPPITPPAQPAAPPEMHEDLEKEFNEWLDSHTQKK